MPGSAWTPTTTSGWRPGTTSSRGRRFLFSITGTNTLTIHIYLSNNFFSFLSSLLGTHKRRRRLRSEWYFDCSCERCVDPTELGTMVSAVLCEACETGYLLPKDPLDVYSEWPCSQCDFFLEVMHQICDTWMETFNICQLGSGPGEKDWSIRRRVKLFISEKRFAKTRKFYQWSIIQSSAPPTLSAADSTKKL